MVKLATKHRETGIDDCPKLRFVQHSSDNFKEKDPAEKK